MVHQRFYSPGPQRIQWNSIQIVRNWKTARMIMLQRSGEWKDISAQVIYHVRFWNSNHKKQIFDQLRSRNTDYKFIMGMHGITYER